MSLNSWSLKKYVWGSPRTKRVVESHPSFGKGLILRKMSLLHLSKRMYSYVCVCVCVCVCVRLSTQFSILESIWYLLSNTSHIWPNILDKLPLFKISTISTIVICLPPNWPIQQKHRIPCYGRSVCFNLYDIYKDDTCTPTTWIVPQYDTRFF
jgi:ABC-type proline/glycine betaine transport system permease subunit